MAYFTFDSTAPQARKVQKLREYLVFAQNLAEEIAAQNAEMDLADAQAQFGVDAGLTDVQWETTINDIVTALNAVAVTNLVNRVGFTS